MEVITYEIQQQVKVRKYNVDCQKLCDLLRKHKKMASLSNKEIAETLNIPITKVEHWFRQDSCFSIPDECIWFELKKLLKITNNEFDLAITTFEEKDNVFEKGNRIYDSDGICPTITCADAYITILDRSNRMEIRRFGNIFGEEKGTSFAGNVWDKEKLCPTLSTMQGGGRQPMIVENPKELGFMDNGTGKHQSNTVYDENALCPNITTIQGGGTQQIKIAESQIVAMRGRNPTNPSDRTPGIETEQRLEPNTHGTCNTITSVQKDNLVLENVYDFYNQKMKEDNVCGTITGACSHNGSGTFGVIKGISTKGKEINVASTVLAGYERTNMTGFNADNAVMETVRIKQATKDGFIECKVGGVADLSYPNSNTRRGRVQDNGNTCPTLTAENQDICRIEKEVINPLKDLSENGWHFEQNVYNSGGLVRSIKSESGSGNIPKVIEQYRIRKLTPKECWRLMDFADEDFEKAAEVNSNTQLYKQAGNSIVKNVLVAILGQMIPGKENVYKELSE